MKYNSVGFFSIKLYWSSITLHVNIRHVEKECFNYKFTLKNYKLDRCSQRYTKTDTVQISLLRSCKILKLFHSYYSLLYGLMLYQRYIVHAFITSEFYQNSIFKWLLQKKTRDPRALTVTWVLRWTCEKVSCLHLWSSILVLNTFDKYPRYLLFDVCKNQFRNVGGGSKSLILYIS